jgi:hypothetical protein
MWTPVLSTRILKKKIKLTSTASPSLLKMGESPQTDSGPDEKAQSIFQLQEFLLRLILLVIERHMGQCFSLFLKGEKFTYFTIVLGKELLSQYHFIAF